jgi:hypothetical protein
VAAVIVLLVSTVLAAGPLSAQVRGPRRALARPVFRGGFYYYHPFFYDPWFPPYVAQGPFPYPYAAPYERRSSLRIQVTPRDAQVFVDGYLAGTVDDFDGFFQHLDVTPGGHEIALYKDGYRTVRQQLYVEPGDTLRVRYTLEPLQPGDPQAPRPAPQPGPAERRPPVGPGPRGGGPLPPRDRGRGPGPLAQGSGSIAIQVQPADAEVLIDGERWQTGSGTERLIVQVGAGRRRIEVRKPGYITFTTEVDVRAGEASALNVSLRSEERR